VFPSLALICLGLSFVGFALGMVRQLWLLRVSAQQSGCGLERIGSRIGRVLVDGLLQRRLRNYRLAGFLHQVIFWGFVLLIPRIFVLFSRAFEPHSGASVRADAFSAWARVALAYQWLKDAADIAVLLAVAAFALLHLGRWERRLRRTPEALGILAVIASMLMADLVYDGTGTLLAARLESRCHGADPSQFCGMARSLVAPFAQHVGGSRPGSPVSDIIARALNPWFADEGLLRLGHSCYALHALLVLGFLVALPHGKHFHIIVALPNLFFDSLVPTGKLRTIAKGEEELLALAEHAAGNDGKSSAAVGGLGKGSLCDYSSKERLNLLACTACGRCTDNCPAACTGKALDPMAMTRDLRAHLQRTPLRVSPALRHLREPLIPSVIDPRAVWACTTCGACEEQCPVAVRHVRSIVDLRRELLLMRGEAPPELQRAFDGMERQQNPWALPHHQRANWAEGLGIERLKDVQRVDYLYWVGCAASYDPRAGSIARAFVRLMQRAGVTFAILGEEEACTGDAARRAGNELLFLRLAERNIRLLNRYQSEGRFQRIVTACPHCLTTIRNEYPDLGGKYQVAHHTEAILEWVLDGHLTLQPPSPDAIVYHDPCTLARYAGITAAPRQLLAALTGTAPLEAHHHGRHTSCCGAGGAQMWMREQNGERISRHRVDELMSGGAHRIVSACPYCLSALSDGGLGQDDGPRPSVCDFAELVEQRILGPKEASSAQ
jgi:Fe-S oxidoreductase